MRPRQATAALDNTPLQIDLTYSTLNEGNQPVVIHNWKFGFAGYNNVDLSTTLFEREIEHTLYPGT